MRAKLQEWAKAWGIYSQVQRFYMKWRHFRHYTGRNWGARRRIVSRYVASTPTRKLHISCGERVVPGWLTGRWQWRADGTSPQPQIRVVTMMIRPDTSPTGR